MSCATLSLRISAAPSTAPAGGAAAGLTVIPLCRGLLCGRNDLVPVGDDQLQGLQGRVAVELLLGLRQLAVRHVPRVAFRVDVARRAVGPALVEAAGRPDLVGVLGQELGELDERWVEADAGRIDGLGL